MRHRFSRLVVGLVVVSFSATASNATPPEPSFLTGGRAPASVLAGLPPDAVVAGAGHDSHDVAQSAPRPSNFRGRERLLQSAAARLRSQGFDVLGALGNAGTADESAGSWAEAFALGDVNGDGTDDVGVLDIALPGFELALRAVQGDAPAVLWTTSLDGAGLLAPRKDLTGDGAADLVRFAIPRFDVLVEECAADGFQCDHYLAEFDWEIGVLSGRDLRPAWTARFSGRVEEKYRQEEQPTQRVTEYRYTVTNGWVLPYLLGTPGGNSILVDSWDLEDTWRFEDAAVPVVVNDTFTSSVRSSHRLSKRRSSDGVTVARRTYGPAPGFAHVGPVADMGKDGHADVLIQLWQRSDAVLTCTDAIVRRECSGQEATADHVTTVVDGRTFDERWARAAGADDGSAAVLNADVDGDGVLDLGYQWSTGAAQGQPAQSGSFVVSGADGSRLWDADASGALTGLGDVDGDGRDDLLRTVVRTEDNRATIELRRLRGIDGTPLHHTAHVLGEGGVHELGYAYRTGDHDRDGSADIAVGRIVYRQVEDEHGRVVSVADRSVAAIESGRAGVPLWELESPAGRTLSPLADLDDDGHVDYDWTGVVDADGQRALDVVVHDGARGNVLWQRPITARSGYAIGVGDLDGDARHDVAVVADVHEAGTWHSWVYGQRGADGSTLWAVRSEP